jgi:hypothetical protein
MSSEVGWHHDEQERCSNREDWNEVGFEADEGAHGKEREGLGWLSPSEEALETVLKDEDHSDSRINVSNVSLAAIKIAYLALKRRKLFVIRGSEKPGLLIYFELLTSGAEANSSTSSSGIICCKSLRRRRLARQVWKGPFMATTRLLTW